MALLGPGVIQQHKLKPSSVVASICATCVTKARSQGAAHSRSSGDYQNVWSSAPVVSKWLGRGNRTFLEVASVVVTCWIVFFFCAVSVSDIVSQRDCSKCIKRTIANAHTPKDSPYTVQTAYTCTLISLDVSLQYD